MRSRSMSTTGVSHLEIRHPSYMARSFGELRELAQTERRVAGDVVLQPAEMSGAEDHQDSLVRRVGELKDVAVDAHVSPEPFGDEVRADPVPRLSEVRL